MATLEGAKIEMTKQVKFFKENKDKLHCRSCDKKGIDIISKGVPLCWDCYDMSVETPVTVGN